MISVITNVATSLPLQLATGDATLFPRALVYDAGGSLDATVNLTHVADGLYRGAHTFTVDGEFDVVFVTFIDGGFATESTIHGRTTVRFIAAASSAAPPSEGQIADAVWDEDVVAAHGIADSAGLLVRALAAVISQRANNPTLDALLGVSDAPGESVAGAIDPLLVFAVAQAWSRSTTPSTMKAMVHLELNGERVTLPGGALLAVVVYEQGGGTQFSQAGITPTIAGADTWFDVIQAFTPQAGTVLQVHVTITGSGVGSGTHVGMTSIAFPEF